MGMGSFFYQCGLIVRTWGLVVAARARPDAPERAS
jgi:hypothetical protein